MSSGGSNGPDVVVNGGANVYDRAVCFDSPVAMDTGLFVDPNDKTLAQLRSDLNLRLGFGKSNLMPPDHNALLDSFLQDANEQCYWRYPQIHTERWWGVQTNPGQRFYDVPIDCTKALEFRRITWAGVADGLRRVEQWGAERVLPAGAFIIPIGGGRFDYEVTVSGATGTVEPVWPLVDGQTVVDGAVTFTCRARPQARWYPLRSGIEPTDFIRDTMQSRPTTYELRQYLEIFPEPDATYVIWLKGHLGVRRFTEEDDLPTVDSRAVFLLALANAKAHFGHPDANNYVKQFEVLIRKFTAGAHGTRKYVPGERRKEDAVRPKVV